MRSHRGLLAVAPAAITTSYGRSGRGGELELWNRCLFGTSGLDPEVSAHEVRPG